MDTTLTTLNAWATGWSSIILAALWQSAVVAVVVALVAYGLRKSSPALRYWLWQMVSIKMLLAPVWTLAVAVPWLPAPQRSQPVTTSSAQDVADAIVDKDVQNSLTAEIAEPKTNDGALATREAGSLREAADSPFAPLLDDVRSKMRPAAPSAQSKVPHSPAVLDGLAALMVLWAAIVLVLVSRLAWQGTQLAGLLRRCVPASAAIDALVATAATRIGLTRVPRVRTVDVETSPFVCGLWRTTLVLPRSLEPLLSDAQITPVLIHELAHVKRRDLLWGWIPQLAQTFYFFNPVAYWAAFSVRLEAELACDGWAMSAGGAAPGAYADLLVRVVSRLSEPALLRGASVASAGLDGLDGQNQTEGQQDLSSERNNG